MHKKIIGLAMIAAILTSGLTGCRQTALDNTRRDMQRVGYKVTDPNTYKRIGTNNQGQSGNNMGLNINNQGQNRNMNTGNNDAGLDKNQIIGYKDTGVYVSGNRIIFPKKQTLSYRNTLYLDITLYINQVTPSQRTDQRGMDGSDTKIGNRTTNVSYAPMYVITLPNSVQFIRYNYNNPSTMYVVNVAKQNSETSIILNENERIIISGGKSYIPMTTLRKIVAVKTVTNPNPVTIEIGS